MSFNWIDADSGIEIPASFELLVGQEQGIDISGSESFNGRYYLKIRATDDSGNIMDEMVFINGSRAEFNFDNYVYNEKTGIWDMVGGVVDEMNGTITVKAPHFSKYAVMENSRMTLMQDVDGHWARDAVYRLVDRGIVDGIKSADGKYRFEPERTVTRAEFAKMLSLSEGYQQNDTDTDLSYFADDAEIQPWARPYLKYNSKKGWIKGKASGSAVYMKPNDTITRAEAAAMISRALGFAAVDKVVKAEFSDKGKIPDWAVGYIDQLLTKKLMLGYSDGTFRPDKVLTRAEAAKIFDTYVTEKGNGL